MSSIAFSQKENLGTNVNSSFVETAPYISSDGSVLFFIRGGHPENTFDNPDSQDIWAVDMKNDSAVKLCEHLEKPFNTDYLNGLMYQSPDGQTRIIKGVFDSFGRFMKNGYSQIKKTKDGWSLPIELRIKGYKKYDKGNYVNLAIAPSGNVMILAMSPIKGDNFTSLYISNKIGDGDWDEPIRIDNLTVGKDFGPFVAADNKSLYFASFRDGGFGDADIWVAQREDDTWLNWSEPQNLGANINSEKMDGYYTVSPSGNYAFLVSDASGLGASDIFRIKLTEDDIKPDPVIIVQGRVKDIVSGEYLSAELEYINLDENFVEGNGTSGVADGSYKVVLPYGKNFSINARLDGYYAESINLDLKEVGEFKTIEKDILLRKIERETVIRLNNIFFETAKSELLPTSTAELNGLIKILKENPRIKIEIRGHTDNVGTAESNEKLSQDRAQAVVNYLKQNGIDTDRLVAKGYGESMPEITNETPEGRQQNRRVECKITSMK